MLAPETISQRNVFATKFRAAQPFPHLVIDGFFERALCEQLIASFPAFERGHSIGDNGLPGGKSVVQNIRSLDAPWARADDLFRSRGFAEWIGEVTGIPGLLYDPDYIGGGTHENRTFQDLDPHVDFNYHPSRGWHRRLNLIVYLNHEWDEAWGGALELHSNPWRPDEDRVERILPLANRAVLFETSERSWHGFRRIRPPGRSRKSLAIYLYTEDRPSAERAPHHATIYVDRPLESGEPREVKESLARRSHRLRFLFDRDQGVAHEAASLIERLLATPGEGDREALARIVERETALLKLLYEREKEWSRDLAWLRAAVAERAFPLEGAARLAAPPAGYEPDRWCGRELRCELIAEKSLATLKLAGDIPAGPDLELRVQAGERSFVRAFPAGQFEWILPCALAAGERTQFSIHPSRCFIPARDRPDSTDGRELSFLLLRLEAVPVNPIVSPEQVSIELTTACNYSCIHCATTIPGYRGRTIDRAVAFRVIDQIAEMNPQPERVRLFGQGEVCVIPWLPAYIAHIRKLLPETQILISTNGSKVAQLAECFVEHRVTHLFLSVEGGTREVHDRIRGQGAYDELIGGLEVLERVKAAAQRERPTFEFTAVLTSETVFDLVNLVELGHRFGARGVHTQALVPHKELGLQRLRLKTLDDSAIARAREHIEEARRRAESYGMEFRHLNADDPFNEPDPEWNDIQRAPEEAPASRLAYRDCLEPWKELWINVAFGLNTCERRRFDVEDGVGAIPLRELLVAPGLEKVRRDLLQGSLDPICGGCILRKPSASPPDVLAWSRERLARRT